MIFAIIWRCCTFASIRLRGRERGLSEAMTKSSRPRTSGPTPCFQSPTLRPQRLRFSTRPLCQSRYSLLVGSRPTLVKTLFVFFSAVSETKWCLLQAVAILSGPSFPPQKSHIFAAAFVTPPTSQQSPTVWGGNSPANNPSADHNSPSCINFSDSKSNKVNHKPTCRVPQLENNADHSI